MDTKATDGDATPANLTVAPGTKFVPLTVTGDPVIPEIGLNDVTVGCPYA